MTMSSSINKNIKIKKIKIKKKSPSITFLIYNVFKPKAWLKIKHKEKYCGDDVYNQSTRT